MQPSDGKIWFIKMAHGICLDNRATINCNALMQMSKDIETNNGEALLMESVFFEDSHEQRVVSLFNNLRDEEYTEWINESEKYLKEISKEISNEKFTFAELEEEEQELEKLISWLKKIESRDIFNSSEGDKARAILAQIKQAFEEYSEMVCSKEIRD